MRFDKGFKVTNNVALFIKQNLEYIDAEEFDIVYDNALNKLGESETGILTEALYAADIDPLKELDYVPDYFLENSQSITDINIPTHVTAINPDAFYGCNNITKVVIPKNVQYIAEWAFGGCDNLKEVWILSEEKEFDMSLLAFAQNYNLTDVWISKTLSYAKMKDYFHATSATPDITIHIIE